MNMTRRQHLQLVAAAAGAAALSGGLALAQPTSLSTRNIKLPKYRNADFYKDGKFQAEAAKKAYFGMMERHGYNMHIEHAKKWATEFWGKWRGQESGT